jgi:hypothetical protein
MSFIRRLISATTPPTKLGRWHLHYDPKIVNFKVDQANEDHCGCCHENENNQTMKQDQMLRQTQKQMQKYSESEEYYIPYVI